MRKKIGQLKLLPLMAKSSDFVHIVHTLNVLPLVPKEDVVSTYEVWYFIISQLCGYMLWPLN